MFKESDIIKNGEGKKKSVNQEVEKAISNIRWKEGVAEIFKDGHEEAVREALEYIKEGENGSLEIIKAEYIKEGEYHATIKLKSHDFVNYIDWEIKIAKYSKGWKFVGISSEGGESVFSPEEE